jgi:2-haloacid dehalogenase
VLVFDVNETLSNMGPMGQRFADVGAPAGLSKLWFAMLLRDGFALTAAGANPEFAEIGSEVLRGVLKGIDLDRSLDDAVPYIMSGMAGLSVHADVAEGVRSLRDEGYRLVTLTNGATALAEGLFERAGIRDCFEALLTVEDAPAWKPAASSYRYAAQACGVDVAEMLLVAVHPWDIDGAARAGLQTAWVNRGGAAYPSYFVDPGLTVTGIDKLAKALPRD